MALTRAISYLMLTEQIQYFCDETSKANCIAMVTQEATAEVLHPSPPVSCCAQCYESHSS